jgi:hypothetical protein
LARDRQASDEEASAFPRFKRGKAVAQDQV